MNFVDIFAGLILGLRPANERCYNVSHWLGANLEPAMYLVMSMLCVYTCITQWLRCTVITHAPLFRGGTDDVYESPLGDSSFGNEYS